MSRAVFRLVTGITAGVATIATTVVAYCSSQADIKKTIAEHFKVSEEKVVPMRYPFIVLEDESQPQAK